MSNLTPAGDRKPNNGLRDVSAPTSPENLEGTDTEKTLELVRRIVVDRDGKTDISAGERPFLQKLIDLVQQAVIASIEAEKSAIRESVMRQKIENFHTVIEELRIAIPLQTERPIDQKAYELLAVLVVGSDPAGVRAPDLEDSIFATQVAQAQKYLRLFAENHFDEYRSASQINVALDQAYRAITNTNLRDSVDLIKDAFLSEHELQNMPTVRVIFYSFWEELRG